MPIQSRAESDTIYIPTDRITHLIMSIQTNKKNQASKSCVLKDIAVGSKISIFNKPYTQKVCFTLVVLTAITFSPMQAQASLFSSIGEFFGIKANAESDTTNEFIHNSQNIPLMESNLTPELKNSSNSGKMVIVDDQALQADVGPLGTSDIEQKYVSTQKIQTYTVKEGDTLDKISKQFGISKNTLINSNDSLSATGKLKKGQVIAILPVAGVAYDVKRGDTIEALAKKYGSSAKEILSYNDMNSASSLQIGDTIVIPGGKKPIVKAPIEKAPVIKAPEKKVAEVIQKPVPKEEISLPTEPKSNPSPSPSGFIWPLPEGAGRISQRLHDDNAVDIAAPKGTPIYAIKDGRVLIADNSGWNGGYGLYVVVDFDDGGQALYGHMSKVASVAGQVVKQGDIIGYVGTTGSSTGNHVHLSLRDGVKNPYAYLKVNNTSYNFK
jgi:murein DD-endopeptidase MepM/ murein hydrolase activator NlpD